MQKVVISKENFDLLEKDTLLTLEQAEWYTQNQGFIPLPRKANRKNIRVIFSAYEQMFFLKLVKSKINKYRNSCIVNTDGTILGYIFVIELDPCNQKESYYIGQKYDQSAWLCKSKNSIYTFYCQCIHNTRLIYD